MKAPLPITPQRRAVQQARPRRMARAGSLLFHRPRGYRRRTHPLPLGRPPRTFAHGGTPGPSTAQALNTQHRATRPGLRGFCLPIRRALTRIKIVVRDRSPATPKKCGPPQRPGPRPSLDSGLLAPRQVTHSVGGEDPKGGACADGAREASRSS